MFYLYLLTLRYAVTETIKYRKQHLTDKPYEEILTLLKTDLINGSFMCLGTTVTVNHIFVRGNKEGKIVHSNFNDFKMFKFFAHSTFTVYVH